MKCQSKFMHFIQENPFENVVWKMAAILPRPQCVNHIHCFLYGPITHPCRNFNGSLTKPPLSLGYERIITSHCFIRMKLLIHALSPILMTLYIGQQHIITVYRTVFWGYALF